MSFLQVAKQNLHTIKKDDPHPHFTACQSVNSCEFFDH
jgi:hypothetical protein